VGKINTFLDEFSDLKAYSSKKKEAHHNHDWREETQHNNQKMSDSTEEKQTDASLRANWLKKVMNHRTSALEHKWLCRILLKNMSIGVSEKTLLRHYSEYAIELWNAHNNLQKVCTILADPAYIKRRIEMEKLRKRQTDGDASIWEPQIQPAVLGNTLSPMISKRSSFEKLMTQTQVHHQLYLKKLYPPSSKTYRPLSLRFPVLTAEIKLDGERMIIHIKNGRVTMNTRNSKWYSELYAPVLGPCLRRSLAKYSNLDVILDGEIESWDDKRKCLVPFGENRAVANYRRMFLKHEGIIDTIDTEKVHDKDDATVMRTASDYYSDKSTSAEEQIERGKNFWLKFVAFDILYVDGSDKTRLYQDCGLEKISEGGSIINIPLLQRKQILYQILTQQENQVEICPTRVIRCNGDSVSGEEYFSTSNPMIECGLPCTLLDSTQATLQEKISGIEDLDTKRGKSRTASQISKLRAEAVEDFYTKVVEDYKFEGVVLKDLASTYHFAIRNFWWKFKPDYETNEAVDIDVVILGASFATGMRNGGAPSGYLVGVVDKFDENYYMTLNNVNAASVNKEKMEAIWKHTGFKKGGGERPIELGKWFRKENYALPNFISVRSLQRDSTEDFNGWKFNKSNYPDIWINPKDSVVLIIKGQELVVSDEHSVGLTLRFPRIKKIRLDTVDGDEKFASETNTDEEIWRIFDETRSRRLDTDSMIGSQSQFSTTITSLKRCRFLTPEEYGRKDKKRKKIKARVSPARKVPKVEVIESQILTGLTFNVLEGIYALDESSFEAQEGEKEGWAHDAKKVKTEEDVIEFVKKHNGTYASTPKGIPYEYIIGGSKDDARVMTLNEGLKYVKSLTDPKKKADKELASLINHEGILKWTFVYSLVHRIQKEGVTQSAIDNHGRYLIPEPHHYLTRVFQNESMEEELFSLLRPISIDEMELALTIPGNNERNRPWQFKGLVDLKKEERWILSSLFTPLWPYYSDGDLMDEIHRENKSVVLYPDVFSDFGFSSEKDLADETLKCGKSTRWNNVVVDSDEIMSVCPLVSVMGGLITPHLHSGVTHIICLLKEDTELSYKDVTSLDIFSCQKRGQYLMDYFNNELSQKNTIKLISANWVRNKFK